MKLDWAGQDLCPEALAERVARLLAGQQRTRGRTVVHLYAPDNPRLFAPGAGGQHHEAAAAEDDDEANIALVVLRRLLGLSVVAGDDPHQRKEPEYDVEVLHLGNTGMDRRAACALARLLREGGAPRLAKLWLKRNAITLEGARAVLQAAVADGDGQDGRAASAALTSLDFFNTGLGPEAASAFAEVLYADKKVKHLYLGGNRFGPSGAAAMARLLLSGSVLTRLSLDISHLLDKGAYSMAEALRCNSRLTYLCLKYNGFSPRGVAALFDALQANPESKLQTLILGWKLTYEELAHKDGVPADELALLANQVGNAGTSSSSSLSATSIVNGVDGSLVEPETAYVEDAGHVSHSVAEKNHLCTAAVEAIVRTLQMPHCPLVHLNLCRTYLTTEELKAIGAAVPRNTSLRQLHLLPQTDDITIEAENRRALDGVRRMLDARTRGPRPNKRDSSEAKDPERPASHQPNDHAIPPPSLTELRKRRREVKEALQAIEMEGEQVQPTDSDTRKNDLEAQLHAIADATRQAKSVEEAARKALRKVRKKQRKEQQRQQQHGTKVPTQPSGLSAVGPTSPVALVRDQPELNLTTERPCGK